MKLFRGSGKGESSKIKQRPLLHNGDKPSSKKSDATVNRDNTNLRPSTNGRPVPIHTLFSRESLTPRPTSSIHNADTFNYENHSAGGTELGENQIVSLEERLRSSREEVRPQSGRPFVPICRQDSILTVEAIEDDIRRCDTTMSIGRARFYARWARQNGRKLYATLAYIERGADVYHFAEQGISDKDLPLNYFQGVPSVGKGTREKGALFLKEGVRIKNLDHWKDKTLEEFYDVQWLMIAPIFEDKTDLELAAREVLPFISFHGANTDAMKPKQGAYSEVSPVQVHPSHHEFWKKEYVTTKEPLVAVKRLFSSDEIEFRKERDILRALGSKKPHQHLIRLLATYRQKEEFHLIFPYAGSNLRSYWEKRSLPEFDHGTVMWALTQMYGIANALFRLHEFKVTIPLEIGGAGNVRVQTEDDGQISVHAGEEMFGRHGDIKPENILWFPEGPEAHDPLGVLKLADFGLGRFHGRDSKSGIRPSGIRSSPTYEPPECKLRRPVSRAYDIWSCGCVWLEFITWLLKGSAGIDEFADRRSNNVGPNEIDDDNFFTIIPDNRVLEATIRDGVEQWVKQLHQHDRCSQLIHDLLNLTMDHLLLIDSNERIRAGQFNRQMEDFYQRANKNPDYMLKPAPSSPEDSKAIFLGIPRYEGSGSQMSFSDPMKVSLSRNSSAPRKSGDLSPKSKKTVTWPSDLAKG
ncbi:hypothetical protein BHYA_0081g00180 [Botrytis hyacinthi]|uniref:Protein kinase domain-containing protein n=1 Tax=Botrytis hyacinthi TaxID=278943 RepID=A0A4Z1GRS1_9HELO|nr:hypothetical protein BHYA_0081g00180 [Botrytis hyacinthi]